MGKIITLVVLFLVGLFFVSSWSLAGLEPPSQDSDGQLALKVSAGLSTPDYHDPIEDWQRVTHREYVGEEGFDDCLECHYPPTHCNQCHTYVGGAPIIPTVTPSATPTVTPTPPPTATPLPPTITPTPKPGETPQPTPTAVPTEEPSVSFNKDVYSIFFANCVSCHQPNKMADFGGDFDLSSYDALMTTGEHAPVVVAGDPEGSLLIQKLRGTQGSDMGETMPLPGPNEEPEALPDELIDLIAEWIAAGAPDN